MEIVALPESCSRHPTYVRLFTRLLLLSGGRRIRFLEIKLAKTRVKVIDPNQITGVPATKRLFDLSNSFRASDGLERFRPSGQPRRQAIAGGLETGRADNQDRRKFRRPRQVLSELLVQNLGQVLYFLTFHLPEHGCGTVTLLCPRHSANDGSVAAYSLGNH
jgi:hypothetical protein